MTGSNTEDGDEKEKVLELVRKWNWQNLETQGMLKIRERLVKNDSLMSHWVMKMSDEATSQQRKYGPNEQIYGKWEKRNQL